MKLSKLLDVERFLRGSGREQGRRSVLSHSDHGEDDALLLLASHIADSSDLMASYRPMSSAQLVQMLEKRSTWESWPISMKIAALAAGASLGLAVLVPDAMLLTSVSAGLGWLYWWAKDFRPRRGQLENATQS